MKTSYLFVAITACALSSIPLASAQDKAASASPAGKTQMDTQMTEVQASATKMRSQMDQIHATTDPTERQKLMQAHMQTMQDSMAMMRSMNKPTMMDGGQGGMAKADDKGAPSGKGMMGGNMMQHHQMMENRIEMMQTMMDQMLQHQQAMEAMPAK